MIAVAYSVMYSGWRGASAAAKSPNQRMFSLLENQLVMVAGNRMIDDAKIGGITPAMFNLSGRCELWPP